MKIVKIDGSQMEPDVLLDPANGIIEFSGYSSPNDARETFQPVIDWLEDYKQDPQQKTRVDFKLKYFNTATSKVLIPLLEAILDIEKNEGKEVELNWYYEVYDEDMEESAEDFEEIINHKINKYSYNP